ncbi:serine hydrolase [Rhodococcus sp. (in: high G+C Gram-positive bacteria)]|uniref:serine hydrolase n=1 Tax=Rhodococcus sp. TaxID=1831 RepID=UPI00257FDF59|nr:serine hydrolase [Rhodococcus sp. (in: high G+C Gram-positive bacteria)]MBQ9052645.1 serine hydrolase [Rhodococcus sp. (in: high G+C Gram-positive bacteria)]
MSDSARLLAVYAHPSVITTARAALPTPSLFEPGTQWNYGSNIDWAELVVEAIRGKRLGEIMKEPIFAPRGKSDTESRVSVCSGRPGAG